MDRGLRAVGQFDRVTVRMCRARGTRDRRHLPGQHTAVGCDATGQHHCQDQAQDSSRNKQPALRMPTAAPACAGRRRVRRRSRVVRADGRAVRGAVRSAGEVAPVSPHELCSACDRRVAQPDERHDRPKRPVGHASLLHRRTAQLTCLTVRHMSAHPVELLAGATLLVLDARKQRQRTLALGR